MKESWLFQNEGLGFSPGLICPQSQSTKGYNGCIAFFKAAWWYKRQCMNKYTNSAILPRVLKVQNKSPKQLLKYFSFLGKDLFFN